MARPGVRCLASPSGTLALPRLTSCQFPALVHELAQAPYIISIGNAPAMLSASVALSGLRYTTCRSPCPPVASTATAAGFIESGPTPAVHAAGDVHPDAQVAYFVVLPLR